MPLMLIHKRHYLSYSWDSGGKNNVTYKPYPNKKIKTLIVS